MSRYSTMGSWNLGKNLWYRNIPLLGSGSQLALLYPLLSENSLHRQRVWLGFFALSLYNAVKKVR